MTPGGDHGCNGWHVFTGNAGGPGIADICILPGDVKVCRRRYVTRGTLHRGTLDRCDTIQCIRGRPSVCGGDQTDREEEEEEEEERDARHFVHRDSFCMHLESSTYIMHRFYG